MSVRVRDMLATILRRAKLTASERVAFENIWDSWHRTNGRLSSKQQAWVEKVYFQQKLDRPATVPPPAGAAKPPVKVPPAPASPGSSGTFVGVRPSKSQPKVAYINHPSATKTLLITNMSNLHELCPDIQPGSRQYNRIKAFFEEGGAVLKIKPVELENTGS